MKWNIEREITYADGTQTFQVEAETKEEAERLFRADKCDLVENDVDVQDLTPWDEIDFNEIYTGDA